MDHPGRPRRREDIPGREAILEFPVRDLLQRRACGGRCRMAHSLSSISRFPEEPLKALVGSVKGIGLYGKAPITESYYPIYFTDPDLPSHAGTGTDQVAVSVDIVDASDRRPELVI